MNNFGAQSADYSSFQFSVFSFQIAEIRRKIVRAALPCRPVCPPRCLKRECARMHAKGKRQTTQFFTNRVVFCFALFSFVNRCAIDPGGTGAPPVLFVPNIRVQNRGATAISSEFPHSKTMPENSKNLLQIVNIVLSYKVKIYISARRGYEL